MYYLNASVLIFSDWRNCKSVKSAILDMGPSQIQISTPDPCALQHPPGFGTLTCKLAPCSKC